MTATPLLRTVCSKLHLWVGLTLSVALVVVSLTGSALVFRHEIDGLLNPALLRVEAGAGQVPLGAILASVREAAPGSEPRLVRLPRTPTATAEVTLVDGRHAFVDPHRGDVLGVRTDGEGAMNTLFALHSKLLSGETGERVAGTIGLLTLLLAASGVVLWWPAVPTRARLRKALTVVWRRGPRRLTYDLHRAGGFYTSLFLVVVAGTGAALVFNAEAKALVNAATRSEEPPPAPVVEEDAPLSDAALDGALAAARRALPDGEPTFVTLPRDAGAPLTVRLKTPSEWHPNGRSYVYLAPADGRVLRTDDAREAPLGARVLYALYPLHAGAFGAAVRVLYGILGLAPAALSVTGTLIWYRRWRKRDRRWRRRHRRPQEPEPPARLQVKKASLPSPV